MFLLREEQEAWSGCSLSVKAQACCGMSSNQGSAGGFALRCCEGKGETITLVEGDIVASFGAHILTDMRQASSCRGRRVNSVACTLHHNLSDFVTRLGYL